MKKLNFIFFMFVVLFIIHYSDAQRIKAYVDSDVLPDSIKYLAQTPPGNVPSIFAPGIVSLAGRNEAVITFSPDGKTIFFSIGTWPNRQIMIMEYKNSIWTSPKVASFSSTRSADEPSFSTDGNRVYYYAYNAPNSVGGSDICYSERKDTIWSEPVNLGPPLNSPVDEYHPCIVGDSSIYFDAKDGEICYSHYNNGTYQPRITLPIPINYRNTTKCWGDPYVSPDESFMILGSTRSGGYGDVDLYISYRKNNKSWTNPKNLGSSINTSAGEGSADITPDGKYMTFSSTVNDIYWVSASFIDSLRHTNFLPYVNQAIPNQTILRDSLFSFQIPDSIFIDDDGNNTLTFSTVMSNGSVLPGWLSFNPATKTFSGIPDTTGTFNLTVTATDTAGAKTTCPFIIKVLTLTGIQDVSHTIPDEIALEQNYPNPFNPTTNIQFRITNLGFTTLKVFDVLGRDVATLVNEEKSAGSYQVQWNAAGKPSGVYFYRLSTVPSIQNEFMTNNNRNGGTGQYSITKKLILLR